MKLLTTYPNYKGFFNNGFFTKKVKTYKNGWAKFKRIPYKDIVKEFENGNTYDINNNFYENYKYDTGAGIIEKNLSEYVVNSIHDTCTSKLKKEMVKFVNWFNTEFQMECKVQIGLFKNSFYSFGNEVFIIAYGYLVGVVRYKKEYNIGYVKEDWYITDFFGKTPNSKKTEKHFNSFDKLKNALENKLHYMMTKITTLEVC